MADDYPVRALADSEPLLDEIVRLIREMEVPAYLVGGSVRDQLLGAQQVADADSPRTDDLDFAVSDDGLRVGRLIADALGGAYYPLDPERGVGRAVLTDDRGRTRFVDVARFQGPDLMADLGGRDFTVNAMALEVTCAPPRLIDPHGGQADLRARRLRAVSDRAVRDDPVRGLRAVRLGGQLGFEIEAHTQGLIREAAPHLANVSAERVRDELCKILSLPPIASWLRQLDSMGLLAQVLPEVAALKGLAQTGRHRWDAYQHTLQAVADLETLLPLDGSVLHSDVPFPQEVSDHLSTIVAGGHSRRLLLTWAALLHDVGKADTAALDPDGRMRFTGHEDVGATMAAEALYRLRFSGDAVRLAETVVRHHLRPLGLTWGGVASKRAIHRFFRATRDVGVEIALLSLADDRARVGYEDDADESLRDSAEYQALLETVRALLDAYFNRQDSVILPAPLLTGRDLIDQFGLQQGPEIGRLLAALSEAQATGQVVSHENAQAWVRRMMDNWGLGTGD